MLRNYLKVAVRHLTRNITFSFINIAGLSLGIAISLLIMLWVVDELSFDKFHPNYKRITQARFFGDLGGDIRCWRELSFPAFQDLKQKHTGIKNVAITDFSTDHLLSTGTSQIYKQGRFASPEFLDIFHFKLISGKRPSSNDPTRSIILTSTTARASRSMELSILTLRLSGF